MRKLICFFILSLFLVPKIVLGFVASEVINHQAPEAYFYPQEFDKLVMDLTLPSGQSGEEDVLEAIAIQNTGTAVNLTDIDKIKIWKDAKTEGFQGMGVDEELGTMVFNGLNYSWYIDNLNVLIPIEGLRIFISVEIGRSARSNVTLQMKLPALSDSNSNGAFDLGDLGVFMGFKNNGPVNGAVINSYRQTISTFLQDNLAPKSVITGPDDNATITTSNYKIEGMARDQGGSTPQWVKIEINDTWYDVKSTSSNYGTWEYEWTDIAEETYILKTQSCDWLGNVETIREGIEVTVVFPVPPVPEEEEEEEVSEEPEEIEKPIEEMDAEELRAKIVEIQQQIIELLKQLIQLIQNQISQIQSR